MFSLLLGIHSVQRGLYPSFYAYPSLYVSPILQNVPRYQVAEWSDEKNALFKTEISYLLEAEKARRKLTQSTQPSQ